MSDETAIEKSGISFETRILVIGSLIGAIVGLAVSFLLVKNNESKGTDLQITTGEGVKLSLIIMTLLRQVADL